MSNTRKFFKFCNDNIVALTVIPLLIGVHWGWYRMQSAPSLVGPNHQTKEIRIIEGAKYLKSKVLGSGTTE